MSTVKVDTIQTTGGASEIAIDKLKGVATASSISVVAEGGSTTTNLQQGLAKMWYNGGLNDQSIADSINVGSLTDTATGNLTINYTNNMASVNYSGNCMKQAELTNASCTEYMTNEATTSTRLELLENSTAIDASNAHAQVHGDLA
tara:strand:- start:78 stop:515 length:438 start_codon:yes stop_codon:yes gene_type:complete